MADTDGIQRFTKDPFRDVRIDQKKLRMGIGGPAGSGKSFTALRLALRLAALEASIDPATNGVAFLDTERDRGVLYRSVFDFKHLSFKPPYTAAKYVSFIRAAEDWGYSVVVIDSLSHGWFAPGGILEFVDSTRLSNGGDKNTAWHHANPRHNMIIDAINQTPIHVIATLRSKQEWLLENEDGVGSARRIGASPVQRDGIEYEFQLYGEMDLDHRLAVTKSNVVPLTNTVWEQPGDEFADAVIEWIVEGEPMVTYTQRRAMAALSGSLTDEEREAANAWFKEQDFRQAALSVDEADQTIANLESLIAARPPLDPEDEEEHDGEETEEGDEDLVAATVGALEAAAAEHEVADPPKA